MRGNTAVWSINCKSLKVREARQEEEEGCWKMLKDVRWLSESRNCRAASIEMELFLIKTNNCVYFTRGLGPDCWRQPTTSILSSCPPELIKDAGGGTLGQDMLYCIVNASLRARHIPVPVKESYPSPIHVDSRSKRSSQF